MWSKKWLACINICVIFSFQQLSKFWGRTLGLKLTQNHLCMNLYIVAITWIARRLKNNLRLCVSRGFLSRPCSKAGPAWFRRGVRSLRTPWKSSSQRTRCYESPTTCAGAEDASRVFVATDAVLQVADDTQEQPGACGRCVIDRTRGHHCWFGHSWTMF